MKLGESTSGGAVVQALQGNLTIADNTNCWFKTIDFVDGVESEAVALLRPIEGVSVMSSLELSGGKVTANAAPVFLSWRMVSPLNIKISPAFAVGGTTGRVKCLFVGA